MDTSGFDVAAVLEGLSAVLSRYGLRVIGAVVVLIVGRMVAGMIRASVRRALERWEVDRALVPFLAGMAYYAILAFVLMAVLRLFGIETTSFIAVLGAAGLAIGLALQGTLGNFAAGVMLLLFRPFKVGDYVEAAGTAGSVAEIGIFTTVLNSPDNVKITVPNATIWGQILKNYSANENRRNDLVIGIAYSDDIGKAIQTIQGILDRDERVLRDPAPLIAVSELADSSVNLVVRPWCSGSDYWPLRFDLTRRIKEELEAAGCSIPFPQTDVHLHQVSG